MSSAHTVPIAGPGREKAVTHEPGVGEIASPDVSKAAMEAPCMLRALASGEEKPSASVLAPTTLPAPHNPKPPAGGPSRKSNHRPVSVATSMFVFAEKALGVRSMDVIYARLSSKLKVVTEPERAYK